MWESYLLILFLLFFISREVKLSLRIGYLLLVAFFIASFYLQPLDLFLARNACTQHVSPSLFLAPISPNCSFWQEKHSTELKTFLFKRLLLSFLGLSTAYLLTWIFQSHYSFIESVSWLLSLAFLLAYAILFISLF